MVCAVACWSLIGYADNPEKNGQKDKIKFHLSEKEKENIIKNLPEQYKRFYEMIYHISTPEERLVFLSLTSIKDRDIFINAFWQQRDPTPGTAANEYKTDVEQRFEYVRKYFSRSSSKPGWMTDMGKFYMILGKPNSIETYDSKAGLYPAQVWYYHGDPTLNLPTYFNVTFFKPNNTTEWKFYNPFSDGPGALLMNLEDVDTTNIQSCYLKIKELAAPLAMPSISMIPNDLGYNYQPSLRTNLVISHIYESPVRKINPTYATDFLNYKGYVNVESSVNFIDSSKLVTVTRNDLFDFNFINVSVKPKKLSVQFSEEKDQYFFNYELNVTLKQEDKSVYEYKKNFDFYIDPNKVNSIKGNGIVIHDSFPAIPGKYKLSVFGMNTVGKEFIFFETDVVVPAIDDNPILSTPIVGHKRDDQTDNFFFTYNYDNRKLYVDTERNFKLKERPFVAVGAYNINPQLHDTGTVELIVKSSNERAPYEKKYRFPLSELAQRRNLNIVRQIGEDGLEPGYYDIDVLLVDGSGKVLDKKRSEFSISPTPSISYAMETFKKVRAENPFYFQYVLGAQYEKAGNLEEAEKYYAKCLQNNPDFKEGYVFYLNVLNKLKKYTQVLVEAEKLKGDPKFQFDYYLSKATALFGMKDYKEAMDELLKANALYNSDIRVLNLLGFTFLNLKQYSGAEKAFKASLNLDSKQDLIQKTLSELKKQK